MAVTQILNIAALKAYTGTALGHIAMVDGYFSPNDGGGGQFVWRTGLSGIIDNGGTIIIPTINISNPSNGVWMRNIEGTSINVRWFGMLGNYADDSVRLTSIITTFKTNDGFNGIMPGIKGVNIIFPKGGYILGDIDIFHGFTLKGDQPATNNVFVGSGVIINPKPNAQYIFKFDTASMNAGLENLNINGLPNTTGSKLIAAVLFRGTFNFLRNNNIVNCRQHTVLGDEPADLMGCRIENNNLQGMTDTTVVADKIVWPAITGSQTGYLGSLHLINFGDSYLLNNEIGANSNYTTARASQLRSSAFFGKQVSNSVISGNIFENADIAAFVMDSVVSTFSGNRYELSIGKGLEVWNIAQCSFHGERFLNNSLGSDGLLYEDLFINENCSNCAFIALNFTKIPNPAIPHSYYKSKWAVTSLRANDVWLNKFLFPYVNPTGFLGTFNNVLPAIVPTVIL